MHLLVRSPKVALSKLANSLKGVSSRYLRAGSTRSAWAPSGPSYVVGSCGEAPLSTVREYIENQKQPV